MVCSSVLRPAVTLMTTEEYTCYANSLARLGRLHGPIRGLKSPEDLVAESHVLSAPRELMRLVNWLMTSNGSQEGLFVERGEPKLIGTILEVFLFLYHPVRSLIVLLVS